MEIIDDLQDPNIFKLNKNLLLRYLGTGVFFWIALVNLVRIVDNLFKLFILQKLESVATVFWLAQIINVLFFFLFTLLFFRIVKKVDLSNKRTFVLMIASLSIIYAISLLSVPFITAAYNTFQADNSVLLEIYSYSWYIVFEYLLIPLKLLIIGLLFFKKAKINE